MKLMIIITSDEHASNISTVLVQHNYRATEIGSTGEFLQYGNTVLLLGVQEEKSEEVIQLLKKEYSNTSINGQPHNGDILLYITDACNVLHVNSAKLRSLAG